MSESKQSTRDTVEIAIPQDDDEVRAHRRLADYAFSDAPPIHTDIEYARWQGVENLRVAKLDGRVVGGLGIVPMGQWFGGKSVPAAGINAVVVSPEVRSRGVASSLMIHALRTIHDSAMPLSILYPATQPVYRRVGYEQAGIAMDYSQPLRGLVPLTRELHLRPVGDEDWQTVRSLYDERARRSQGNLDRHEHFWTRRTTSRDTPVNAYLVEPDGRAEGYIIYIQGRRGNGKSLILHDLVALTAQAYREIVSFLAQHRSVVSNVSWMGPPNDPLLNHIPNQEYSVPYYEQWMLRIVDVKGALEARGYPKTLRGRVEFSVRDDVLDWNNGSYVVEVSDGTARVIPGNGASPTIDVRGLAPLYTGYLSAADVVCAGFASELTPKLGALGQLFAGAIPWMADGF